jgi:hypothetical protein
VTGAIAFFGVFLGWIGSWMCGRSRRRGWLFCACGSAVWVPVNLRLHLLAGVLNSAVAVTLALRNWRLWRATATSPAFAWDEGDGA